MQSFNTPPAHRLNLCETTCEVRDERWAVRIDAGDEPCNVRVFHRQYGDFYDWPEAVFDSKVRAAIRAYDISDNEVTFRTRGAALTAGHAFLKSYGAGEVEYLEWDINSQSMVVVGHSRRDIGLWWGADKPDPLAPFFPAPEAPTPGDQSGSGATDAAKVVGDSSREGPRSLIPQTQEGSAQPLWAGPVSIERLIEDLRWLDTGPPQIDGWGRNRCKWAAEALTALSAAPGLSGGAGAGEGRSGWQSIETAPEGGAVIQVRTLGTYRFIDYRGWQKADRWGCWRDEAPPLDAEWMAAQPSDQVQDPAMIRRVERNGDP